MGISIALNLLPLIKSLNQEEQKLHALYDVWIKLSKLSKKSGAASTAEKQVKQAMTKYIAQVKQVEDIVQDAAETLFYKIISRTARHTNRAAGSWAIDWNDKASSADLGFADPNTTNEITFYSGKRDWYPEAPITEKGTKVLGVHDWGEIIVRHRDMVNSVIQNLTFTREWGKTNAKGQMIAHKTIFIYNECPYIEAMENGAFDVNPSGNMVALSVAEVVARLEAGGEFPKKINFT